MRSSVAVARVGARASPPRVLLAAWAVVIVSYLLSVSAYDYGVSTSARNFIAGFLVFFTIGYWFGRDVLRKPDVRLARHSDAEEATWQLRRIIRVLALVGAIGSLMMTVDYLFFRQLDYSTGLAGVRSQLQQNAGGAGAVRTAWAVGSRFLSALAPVAVASMFLRSERVRDRSTALLSLGAFGLHLVALALTGGRNGIAVALVFVFAAALVRRTLGKRLLPPLPAIRLVTAVALPAALGFFLLIFRARQQLSGRSSFAALTNLQDGFLVNVRPPAWASAGGSSLGGLLLLPLVQLQIYLTHSLQELGLLLAQRPTPGPFYGLYSLFVPGVFLSRVGLVSADRMDATIYSSARVGVYETALGSTYRDVGILGTLIVGFAIGVAAGVVWRRLIERESLRWELSGAYLLAGLLLSPVVLILNTGTGFELLLAVMAGGYIIRRTERRNVGAAVTDGWSL